MRPVMRLGDALGDKLRRRFQELRPALTDSDKLRAYANPPDPVGFARDVFGLKLWSRQREIVEAVGKHKRVSVASGHKCGKSTSLAVLALWFYCSFPESRVVITATSDRQVNGIIWREIKRLVRKSKLAIPGASDISIRAQTGLTSPIDYSEIRGYTASEAEAIAGTSAPYILYLVDEASGVKDFIFEAIEGNRAGGNAWVFLISNPTRAEGEFYDSHHSKVLSDSNPKGYKAIHIDSRESPNITGEWRELWDKPLGGLASNDWVEEKLEEWGEDHPLFKVRVAGLFSVAEEAKIFALEHIEAMHDRWSPELNSAGRLYIGVDPSGDGDGGDEGGFCARRGSKVLELRARAGLPPAAYIHEIEDLIASHCPKGGDPLGLPLVMLESEGEVGWKVYIAVREYAEKTDKFEVHRMRTSDKAWRQPKIYGTLRDEMWANARAWGKQGGAVPENSKLAKDLHAPEFKSDIQGRLKVTPKKELRKLLGRSPDTGDAFVLSCWEPLSARVEETNQAQAQGGYAQHSDELDSLGALDPYSGMAQWQR